MSKEIDPIEAQSDVLRTYMSNKPDTLIAYAKWYGKVQEAISIIDMTAIDTKVHIISHRIHSIALILVLRV
jgi:hypothetical protein